MSDFNGQEMSLANSPMELAIYIVSKEKVAGVKVSKDKVAGVKISNVEGNSAKAHTEGIASVKVSTGGVAGVKVSKNIGWIQRTLKHVRIKQITLTVLMKQQKKCCQI